MPRADLTVGITTRNRHASVVRCVESLRHLASMEPEVLVFDDGSDLPVAPALAGYPHVRVIRDDRAPGYIVGRNALVRHASKPFVLLLDDDAAVTDGKAIEAGLAVLTGDGRVGAVGFAQANADGTPWPESMQPATGAAPRYITAYIGFAHLLRRDLFLEMGGYRESFVYYGEEKDYCLRLIDRGYRTVYLPQALLFHLLDPSGRSRQRYLRYVSRNDLLYALYNEPLGRLSWSLPARFLRYFVMRHRWEIRDPFGWLWVASEVARLLPQIARDRRPVSRETMATWRALRDRVVPYVGAREHG